MYIIVDLDQTLLNSHSQVSTYTLLKLNEFRSQGHFLVVNTARSFNNSLDILNIIRPDYIILNGGSLILDRNYKIIFKEPLENKLLDELLIDLGYFSEWFCLQTFDKLYTSNIEYKSQGAIYKDFKIEKINDDIYKIIFVSSLDRVRELQKKYDLEIFNYLNGNWYRITPKNVTKFYGVKKLIEILKADINNTIAFGDDYSDLEMIKKCGHGVCMANSISEVLSQVENVALSNDEDGVVKYLEVFLNERKM